MAVAPGRAGGSRRDCPVGQSRWLLEQLQLRKDLLHRQEVRIACPYFDVVLEAQRGDHSVGERYSYSAGIESREVVANGVPARFRCKGLMKSAEKSKKSLAVLAAAGAGRNL